MNEIYIIGRENTKDIKLSLNNDNSSPKRKYNYFNIRNAAWKFLLENEVTSYPLDLNKIVKQNNWRIFTYYNYTKISNLNLDDLMMVSENGCCVTDKNHTFYHILYNPSDSPGRNRFTIAHEIGHIILHKRFKGKKLETEANMFAARILMPMILIKELNIETAEELSELCNVSVESASFRLERYLQIQGRNKFYSNPLEFKLYENLKTFIESKK